MSKSLIEMHNEADKRGITLREVIEENEEYVKRYIRKHWRAEFLIQFHSRFNERDSKDIMDFIEKILGVKRNN